MRIILQCLIFLFFASLAAQEGEIRGKITNDSLGAPVHIINLTREQGSLSDFEGNFTIQASEGDSIQFSSVQYKKKFLIITSEMIVEEILKIKLEEEITELDEVELHKLSGNLAEDLENIEIVNFRKLGLSIPENEPPTIVERKISALSDPQDPAGQLYGWISGEKKKLKKAKENQDLTNKVLKAKQLVTTSFLKNNLGLKENELSNFLYFCAQEKPGFHSLVEQEKALELIELCKSVIDDYRAQN